MMLQMMLAESTADQSNVTVLVTCMQVAWNMAAFVQCKILYKKT